MLTDDQIRAHIHACMVRHTPSAKHFVVRLEKDWQNRSGYSGEIRATLKLDRVFNGHRVLAYRMSGLGCALLVCGANVTTHYFLGFRSVNICGIDHVFHYDGHNIKVYVELEATELST